MIKAIILTSLAIGAIYLSVATFGVFLTIGLVLFILSFFGLVVIHNLAVRGGHS